MSILIIETSNILPSKQSDSLRIMAGSNETQVTCSDNTTLEKAKEEFLKYAKENEDPVFGKLLYMIKGYRLYDQKWTEELREILYYSYKNPIIYPKGKF